MLLLDHVIKRASSQNAAGKHQESCCGNAKRPRCGSDSADLTNALKFDNLIVASCLLSFHDF